MSRESSSAPAAPDESSLRLPGDHPEAAALPELGGGLAERAIRGCIATLLVGYAGAVAWLFLGAMLWLVEALLW